ncbi:MAG: YcxB family protein [Arenimonas sp.]
MTEQDYVAAHYLNLRRNLFWVVLAFAAAGIIFWFLYTEAKPIFAFTFVIIGFAVILGLPGRIKKNFRQYKALSEPFSVEVKDEGLYFTRTNGSGLVPWSEIIKWRYNEKSVMFYPGNNVFHLIPGHFFSSDSQFQEFIAILDTKLGKAT